MGIDSPNVCLFSTQTHIDMHIVKYINSRHAF